MSMKKLVLQIGLVLLGLVWCAPAHAVFANFQHKSALSATVSGFTAIPTGSLIVATLTNDASSTQVVASAGASGAGTWIIPSTCTGTSAACNKSDPNNGGHSLSIQYILSSTGTPTTITCTASAGTIAECAVDTVTFTSGPVSVDVGTTTTRTAAANQPGLSPGTLTGSNDIIVQWAISGGSISACSGATNLFAAGCTAGEFPNGNGNAVLINTASNTAGSWTSTSGSIGEGAIAFKEAAASGGTRIPSITITGAGD